MAWTKTEKNEKLSKLSDVNFSNLSDGQVVTYNETEDKWENTDYSKRRIALGKLTAGETTVTISDENLTVNSTVEAWTSIDGVNYNSIVVNNGSVTLTYPAQESDMKIKIVFFNDTDFDFINSIKSLKMTKNSYTDSNGYEYTASASSERFPAYYVFNGLDDGGWRPSDFSTNGWIMLEISEYCKVLKHTIYMHFDGNATTKILFQGSNDGTTFNTLEIIDLGNTTGGNFERTVETNPTNLYKYYRWYYETNTGGSGTYMKEITFNDVSM